jgi:hypothetical protein
VQKICVDQYCNSRWQHMIHWKWTEITLPSNNKLTPWYRYSIAVAQMRLLLHIQSKRRIVWLSSSTGCSLLEKSQNMGGRMSWDIAHCLCTANSQA